MRILILHSRYQSGAASGENRVAEDEARLLEAGGHDVRSWAPDPPEASGLRLLSAGAGAVWSRHAAAEVRRLVRAHRTEVVHCHNLFPALSPAVIRAATGEGAAVVVTLHSYRFLCLSANFFRDGHVCEDCLGRRPWPGVVHACYRGSRGASGALAASLVLHEAVGTLDRIRLYLAVSGFVRERYITGGFPRDRVRVKHNFAWPTDQRSGSGEYFLFLGRLAAEKGTSTLLRAWTEAPAPLLVVGDGPERERLRALAPPGVEFRDTVSPSEVPGLLRRARALLIPSAWYEGAPRGIIEAYAAGVPVIASRIGALPEVVAEEESGLLLPPDDAEAWRDGVRRLMDDAEVERLGRGARMLWEERYTPERGLDGLEAAYREAISAG
jgi:glycosyltransferase involved in cell wall biosynthesis